MGNWRERLRFDPVRPLLASGNEALRYFARRDLEDDGGGSLHGLWRLPEAERILKRQQADGAWIRGGMDAHPAINYRLIETWRYFRHLVGQYGFTRDHPQAKRAAEFLFSCQSIDGDFRGMLANQYATYYTGSITGLLINAGYEDDPRIERAFQWLLSMRQDDLGWTIPLLTHKLGRAAQYRLTSEYAEPLEPDRSKPFSHNWTGMVLRAFAAHSRYRRSEAAGIAARLLKARFFRPDSYTSYQEASYWLRFEYPFWWNNLVAALDSLSLIGLSSDDGDIARALDWLVERQEETGLWKASYTHPNDAEKTSAKAREMKLWVSLAICRVFKRLCA
jgi:hypothetical protein